MNAVLHVNTTHFRSSQVAKINISIVTQQIEVSNVWHCVLNHSYEIKRNIKFYFTEQTE